VGFFRCHIAALAAACLVAAPAAAEVYRWTDAQGKVHYTSDLNRVPESQREAAKASAGEQQGGAVMRIESRPPPTPAAPAATPPAEPPRPAEEMRGGRSESWWRAEAATHRESIARLEQQTEACTAAGFRWSAGAGGRAYREETAEADACGRIQSELQMNRKWLDAFEESAHRAAVPPGWLRD